MGSNEAGEQRAGREETLLRFPDGLIHPHGRTYTQTHPGSNTLIDAHLQRKGVQSRWHAHGSILT